MNDNAVPFGKQAEQIIAEYAKEAGIPVCFNFPAGHIADNRALILGREVQLDISPNGVSLQFLAGGNFAKSDSVFRKMMKPVFYFLGFFVFMYVILYLIGLFLK